MGGQPTIEHIDNRWFVKLSETAGRISFVRSFRQIFGTMGLYGPNKCQNSMGLSKKHVTALRASFLISSRTQSTRDLLRMLAVRSPCWFNHIGKTYQSIFAANFQQDS